MPLKHFPPGAWPEGSLPAILEHHGLFVVTMEAAPWGCRVLPESVRVTCTATGPETIGDSGADLDKLIGEDQQRFLDGLARAVRETMYQQAENAIAAALDAGWALELHPEITVKGTITHDRETGLNVPCAELEAVLVFRRG